MAKLLPSLNSAIVKYQKSSIVKPSKFLNVKTKTISVKGEIAKDSPKILGSSLSDIEKKVIQVDKLLKDSLLLSKKEEESKRKTKEKEKFEGKEKELEKKKPNKVKGINLPSPPKMGFLDWIKNFITQTILGFFAVRLIDFLPQLLKILPVIIKVGDFFIDVGGKMLDGLITFVDWGYKAIDGTRSFIKQLGGEGLAQNFDKFAGAIDNVIEIAVIAAIVTASQGRDDGGGKGGRPLGWSKEGGGRRGLTYTGKKFGGDAQRGSIEVQKRYFQKYGRDAFIKRFGEEGIKNLPKSMQRGFLQRGARSAFTGLLGKGGAKAVLKFVRPLLKRIPIPVVGALIDFGLSWALGEDPGRAAFRAIGAGILGTIGGGLAGVLGLTTGPGALAIGALGALAGGTLGDMAGGAIYDLFFGGKKSKGKTVKAAGGGQPSTRGGKPVSGPAKRTIKKKKTPRTLRATPSKLKPGGSVGGEKKIKQLFPEAESKDKSKNMSPFDFLKKSYETFSKSTGLGALVALAIKPLMGDKPTYADYKNVGVGINNWMNSSVGSGTLAYAGGGEVKMESIISGEDYSDVIAKSVQDSVAPQVDRTIQDLMKQLMLKKEDIRDEDKKKEEGITPTEGMEDATLSDSEMDLFQRLVLAESGGQGKIGMSLVARSVLNRAGLIQSGKATIGTFGAKDKTVTGVIMGPNQYQPIRDGSIGRQRTQAQMDSARDAIKLAQNPNQLRSALKSEGLDDDSINKLLAATGFRTGSAFTDPSQNVNVVKYKDHYFNTAGNKNLIVASSEISEYSGEKIGGLSGGGGRAIFGETGNVSNSPGWVHGHFQGSDPRSVVKDTSSVVKALLKQGSPVYLNPGVDLVPGKQYSDSEIIKYVEGARRAHTHSGTGSSIDVFVKKGTRVPVSLTDLGPSGSGYGGYGRGGLAGYISGTKTWIGHLDPSSISGSTKPNRVASKFHGGIGISPKDGFILKLHKGEMYKVVDKDSVDLFGKDFIEDIIGIENKSQLVARAPSIIQRLKAISGYMDYEKPEPEIVYVPVPSGDSGGSYGGTSKSSLSYDHSTIDNMGEQMNDNLMYG